MTFSSFRPKSRLAPIADFRGPEHDEPAQIIASLVGVMDQWQLQNLDTVHQAVAWLKFHDRRGRVLNRRARAMIAEADEIAR